MKRRIRNPGQASMKKSALKTEESKKLKIFMRNQKFMKDAVRDPGTGENRIFVYGSRFAAAFFQAAQWNKSDDCGWAGRQS